MAQGDMEATYPELVQDARTLLVRCDVGVLSTLDPRDGIPYASLVEIMEDDEQGVWMFLSDLAAHSTNLLADGRASILVREPTVHGAGSALGLQRLTLMGEVRRVQRSETLTQSWLQRHPQAAGYIGFTDFNFYQLHISRARYVAGFGRMGWLDEEMWRAGEALEWAASIDGIMAHMNEDHTQNLIDYVHAQRGECPVTARMVGVDDLGCDVEVTWAAAGGARVRLMFSERAGRVERVRKELVRMAHQAREEIAQMTGAL